MQLQRYKAKVSKIRYILISHLHGDHFFGLIGLLNTMSLNGREQELHLFAPPDLSDVITTQLRCSRTVLNFPIRFHPLESGWHGVIIETNLLTVATIPMEHGVPCFGFLFREKEKLRRINKEVMPSTLTVADILALKEGKDLYYPDGSLQYKNESLTLPPRKSRSYAYCSDTRYNENIIPYIQGVDLLYHETTFMKDQEERAWARYHSTTTQAATLAQKAGVQKLLIGHYSSRYKELEPLLQEAQAVFSPTQLAIEGQTYIIEEL